MYDDFLWEEMQAILALSSETASGIHRKTEAPLTSTKTIFSQYQDHYFLARNDGAVTGKAFVWRCCKCSKRYKFTSADGFSLLPFPHAFIDCMASQGKSGLPSLIHTHTHQQEPSRTNRDAICRWQRTPFPGRPKMSAYSILLLSEQPDYCRLPTLLSADTDAQGLRQTGWNESECTAVELPAWCWPLDGHEKESNKAANCSEDDLTRKRAVISLEIVSASQLGKDAWCFQK